jgi:hypothetical protein
MYSIEYLSVRQDNVLGCCATDHRGLMSRFRRMVDVMYDVVVYRNGFGARLAFRFGVMRFRIPLCRTASETGKDYRVWLVVFVSRRSGSMSEVER